RGAARAGGAGADELPGLLQAVRASAGIARRELLLERPEGETLAVEVTAGPVRDEAGQLIGISVIARDIAERKRAEEERAERIRAQAVHAEARERQSRTLANSIPQLAWMADASGSRFWFNQRWCEYTGTTL